MKIVKPSFKILTKINSNTILKNIERAGRICYKSESKITKKSSEKFVKSLISRGHESVIEHESISVLIICDRGISHEQVRHRIASYSQESSRYVSYCKGVNKGVKVIDIQEHLKNPMSFDVWVDAMINSEKSYNKMIELGETPQIARSVLPNSMKTEIVVTMNLRSWRNFFKLRTAIAAHPQMREIAIPLLKEFQKKIPIVFDDIEVK